jgi:hypothetical protein
MKKVTLSEEFVLEAHEAACIEWKAKIEKEVPKLFQYKVGDKFIRTEGFYKDHTYILAKVSSDGPQCSLIDLKDGLLWDDGVKVADLYNISKAEFIKISCDKGFKKIV